MTNKTAQVRKQSMMAGTSRSKRLWKLIAALAAGSILASGLQPGGQSSAVADTASAVPPLPAPHDVHAKPLETPLSKEIAGRRAAAEVGSAPVAAPIWPTPADQVVTVGAARSGTSTVTVGAVRSTLGKTSRSTPAKVRLRVLDRAKTERAGIDGVLLTAARADNRIDRGTAQISIDYSAFANAYGGDWRTRLRLVSLPACALTTPKAAGCLTPTDLGSANDLERQTLTAPVSVDSQDKVLAVTAASASSSGDYTATSLSPASSWVAGSSSGDFAWSYPLRVPPATGGPSPKLEIEYSAQSVDGRTVAANNQPSWIGEGFQLADSYVERKYASCDDEGHTGKFDLCWKHDNATLVMNGKSNELVKSGSTWRLKDEDGSKVEKVTGDNPDNNHEAWKVTTQDGTQYFFGRNLLPGLTTLTNSVWTVPVSGDTSGEECYNATFANSFCDQAWRWNLDYVVDPHGNAMTLWYAKETNYYAKNGASTATAAYTRGGYLTKIRYGERSATLTATAPMQVNFVTQERCLTNCGSLTSTTKANWPDVPFDQICASGAACTKTAPSFFSRRRLDTITTQVLKGSTYQSVDQWQLAPDFPDPGDVMSGKSLWLQSITHTGVAPSATPATPLKVTFGKAPKPNRVDGDDGLSPMTKIRVGNIWTETGAQITVNYSDPECIASTHMPASADRNTMRCYPVKWTPPREVQRDDWFHRYVVNQVRVSDATGNGDAVVTNYTYSGGGAWHYQENAFIPAKDRNWSDWRGYETVTVSEGDPVQPGPKSRQVTTYFRGMNGDKLAAGGTKSETVTDTAGGVRVDAPALAGKVRESITYQAAGSNAEVSGAITDYWVHETASQTLETGLVLRSNFVKPSTTQSRTARDGNRPDLIRNTTTTYDDSTGLAIQSQDAGDSAKIDETCTVTSYASNTTAWLIAFPSRVVTSKGLCDAGSVNPPKDRVLSDSRTLYDAGGFGVAPTSGEVRSVQRLSSYDSAGVAQYQTTVTNTYDTLGRATATTDALGRTTNTTYTPAGQGALTATMVEAPPVTAPDGTSKRLTTKTTFLPEWGVATQVIDPNQKLTDLTYDTMGRLTAVWLPNRSKSAGETANTKYTYSLSSTAASSVKTDTLNITTTGYNTSYAFYDALLRPRQTQRPAAVPGRIITETKYDSRGLAAVENADMFDSGEPSGTLVSVLDGSVPAETLSTYDGAGRLTASTFAVFGQTKWTSRKVYGGDTVTTLPPAGSPAIAEISDIRGQVIERREYDSNTITAGFIPSTYTYDMAGRLTKLVSGGSTWTYTYDSQGRKVSTTDPDAGDSTYGYDAVDRLVSTTNANQKTLLTTYDNLDRKLTLHEGAKTDAQLLADWTYDAAGNLGQLYGSTRYTAGKTGPAYKTKVTSRNVLYKPITTSVVIPTAEGTELDGTYNTNTDYSEDDQTPAYDYLPGGGTVGAEKLTYLYNRLGQPTSLVGGYNTYVNNVTYTELGDPEEYALGEGRGLVLQQQFESGTRRLARSFTAGGPTIFSNRGYTYDAAGNVLKDDNVVGPDVQCFDYDGHRRLTSAWTPSSGDCAATPTASALGGPAQYWQSWTYNPNGQRKTDTNHTTAGDTTATYTYDPGQQHAVSKIATTGTAPKPDADYSYDPAGNTTSRPGATGQQTLSWSSEGKLSKLSSQQGDTNYIYDAEGNLLLRKSPTKSTLFVGSLEMTVESSSGAKVVTSQRHYSIGGKEIAVRSTPDKLDWLVTDYHNTSQLTLDRVTLAPTTRYTTPFGAPRGPTAATWPDTHGFLGKPEDPATGLTHVGAREYDPATGRFISVDPVLDPADPQSLLAYAYANNNPVTLSDPDGLCALSEGETRCGPGHTTPTPPPSPGGSSGGGNDRPTPSSSNGSSDHTSYDSRGDGLTQPAAPHPDRMFEMAGCNGGPGCVMPEGYAGKYGSYRPIPGEELLGELILVGLFWWSPGGKGVLLARASGTLRLGSRAAPVVAEAAAKTVDIGGAKFAQTSFSETFSKGGLFSGRSINDVAGALRSGAMSPKDIPINVVVRDGNTLITNTRSAQALTRAGIPRDSWNVINRTGDSLYERLLSGQLGRNGLASGGTDLP